MPRNGLTQWLHLIWQLPAELRWMDPLPVNHRRGIIAGVLLILLAFLWPAPAPQNTATAPQRNAAPAAPLQAEIVDNSAQNKPAQRDAEGRWHSYTISEGQTLAQLFRDNNLQVNDVFAMARVEGDDKPLSNLQRGQQIKVRIDAQGVVTGLTVEGSNGPVLFTRQADGSFIRAQ